MTKPDDRPKKRKVPRKVTAGSLENAALYYLGRYATSSENLRHVLGRRISRAAKHHDTDIEACTNMVNELIGRYLQSGLLDDVAYARYQAASHNRRGKSVRAIRLWLQQKCIAAEIIDEAILALAAEIGEPDLAAAIAYARKRRFGPYRNTARQDENRDRELAALARNGFSYSLSRRIVEAKTIEELEDVP